MDNFVIAEIRIIPLGAGSTSTHEYVAAAIKEAKKTKDIQYQVNAMGTVVQGPLSAVLELARKMHEAPFTMGMKRVNTLISIDDRRDKPRTMEEKVREVL